MCKFRKLMLLKSRKLHLNWLNQLQSLKLKVKLKDLARRAPPWAELRQPKVKRRKSQLQFSCHQSLSLHQRSHHKSNCISSCSRTQSKFWGLRLELSPYSTPQRRIKCTRALCSASARVRKRKTYGSNTFNRPKIPACQSCSFWPIKALKRHRNERSTLKLPTGKRKCHMRN